VLRGSEKAKPGKPSNSVEKKLMIGRRRLSGWSGEKGLEKSEKREVMTVSPAHRKYDERRKPPDDRRASTGHPKFTVSQSHRVSKRKWFGFLTFSLPLLNSHFIRVKIPCSPSMFSFQFFFSSQLWTETAFVRSPLFVAAAVELPEG